MESFLCQYAEKRVLEILNSDSRFHGEYKSWSDKIKEHVANEAVAQFLIDEEDEIWEHAIEQAVEHIENNIDWLGEESEVYTKDFLDEFEEEVVGNFEYHFLE